MSLDSAVLKAARPDQNTLTQDWSFLGKGQQNGWTTGKIGRKWRPELGGEKTVTGWRGPGKQPTSGSFLRGFSKPMKGLEIEEDHWGRLFFGVTCSRRMMNCMYNVDTSVAGSEESMRTVANGPLEVWGQEGRKLASFSLTLLLVVARDNGWVVTCN